MSKQLSIDLLGLGVVQVIQGTVDPSAGGGVVAAIGSLYVRSTTGQLWQKTGAGNTAWTQFSLVPAAPVTPNGSGFYGTGIDGNLTFDGAATVGTFAGLSLVPAANVYTLTRDIFANNMSVSTGVRINPAGFRIFVLNTLTLTGTASIAAPGGNGGNGTAGAGGAAGAVAWLSASSLLAGGQAGVAGGAPDAGSGGSGSNPGAINSHLGAATANTAIGGNGGVLQGGGGGGNNNNPGSGSVGIAPNAFAPTSGRYFYNITQAVIGRDNSNAQLAGGTAGSSGRGAGASVGGGGGGGGASGPTFVVFARVIAGAGSINALGGNGGNGLTGGGGGAGASGGVIVLATQSTFPLSITLSVAGGTPGNQGGSAPGSSAGSGGTGMTYLFNA